MQCVSVPKHAIMRSLNVTGRQGNAPMWCLGMGVGGVVGWGWNAGVEVWVRGTQWEKLPQMEPQTHWAALNASCIAQEDPWDPRATLADTNILFHSAISLMEQNPKSLCSNADFWRGATEGTTLGQRLESFNDMRPQGVLINPSWPLFLNLVGSSAVVLVHKCLHKYKLVFPLTLVELGRFNGHEKVKAGNQTSFTSFGRRRSRPGPKNRSVFVWKQGPACVH